MSTKIPPLNQNYKIYQTANQNSKGIAIIVKYEMVSKEEKCNEHDGWIKLISLNSKRNKLFVIGVYVINENKERVIREIEAITNRIRRMYADEQIIGAGDFNMKPNQVYKIEKIQLKCNSENKTLWTREQKYKNTMKYSTLDYILSSLEMQKFNSRSTQGVSDHYLINWDILTKIPGVKRTYSITRIKRNPNIEELKKLKESNLPLEIAGTLELAKYKTTIRPKLFVYKQMRYCAGVDIKWEVKQKYFQKNFKQKIYWKSKIHERSEENEYKEFLYWVGEHFSAEK